MSLTRPRAARPGPGPDGTAASRETAEERTREAGDLRSRPRRSAPDDERAVPDLGAPCRAFGVVAPLPRDGLLLDGRARPPAGLMPATLHTGRVVHDEDDRSPPRGPARP